MTDYSRPSHSPAWAESGDKVEPTSAEIQEGWPLTSVPPSRQRFNWILNWLANAVRYFLQLGISEWNSSEVYRVGSRVQYSGLTYVAIQAGTNKQPDTQTAYWERWGYSATELNATLNSVLSKSVAGSADVTLTAAESVNGIIVLTGALTGSINVIVPNAARRWIVRNSTTGAYTVTFKTTGGTGVTVYRGANHVLFSDGTNVNDTSPRLKSQSFTATSGQTDFTVAHVPGNVISVTRNGSSVDFTDATDGSKVTIAAATTGDTVIVRWL